MNVQEIAKLIKAEKRAAMTKQEFEDLLGRKAKQDDLVELIELLKYDAKTIQGMAQSAALKPHAQERVAGQQEQK